MRAYGHQWGYKQGIFLLWIFWEKIRIEKSRKYQILIAMIKIIFKENLFF
jgi:hypothetical protein